LQEYLLKNLMLSKICKFINLVKTLILFVLKSNNNLRLYIDYYNLNIIIIKKTLNCLINISLIVGLSFDDKFLM